jgi:hypothetical protein
MDRRLPIRSKEEFVTPSSVQPATKERAVNKKLIYGAIGFVALVGSMELSRPHVAASPVQPTVAPTHVMTAAEQCAAVSGAIENCEGILSGKVAAVPYADNSKLDFGRSDPQASDLSIFDPVYTPATPAEQESNRLRLDLDRARYGVGVAQRHLETVIRGY